MVNIGDGPTHDIFRRHLATPAVSVIEHYQYLASELNSRVQGRRCLYLDTRYWVFLRDAALGRAQNPEHAAILRVVRDRVAAGVAICPVSDVAVMELTTQTDDETRTATGELWDELSQGVALQTEQDRIRIELEQFLLYPREEDVPGPLQDLVWTRPGFVFGLAVPSSPQLSAEVNQALQKASMDVLWDATFSDLAKDSSEALAMKNKFQQTAKTINEKLKEHQHEIVSFEQTFVTEIAGALNANEDLLSDAVLRLYRRQGSPIEEVSEEQVRNTRRQMRTMFTNLFRLKRALVAKRLPTIYMQALCHAAFRMDLSRRFNGNFLRDLHHGTAGVVYHDAILTEKPLAVLLTSGNVAADKLFGCRVMSDERDVLDYLENL